MEPASTQKPVLPYGPRRALSRRQIRLVVATGVILAIAIASIRWGPELRHNWHLLSLQQSGCLEPIPGFMPYRWETIDDNAPAELRNATTTSKIYDRRIAACGQLGTELGSWQFVGRSIAFPIPFPRTGGLVVFMNRCRTPAGDARFVMVAYAGPASYGSHFNAWVLEPGTLFHPPRLLWTGPVLDERARLITHAAGLYRSGPAFCVGQVDPRDPTRFAIRSYSNGIPFEYVGQLRNDDTVLMTVPNPGTIPLN